VAFAKDANSGYAGNGPQAMATLRNLAISLLYLAGITLSYSARPDRLPDHAADLREHVT
jgi:hypothetical protein